MTDLDQLLRDTLHGRAATITDAPPVPEAADHGRDRSRWLLVAATVAAVLVAGGGAAVWGLPRGPSGQHAGGGYAQSCRTPLPAAWKKAFAAGPITANGRPAYVSEVTPYGDVIGWSDERGTEHLGLRATSGTVRSLDAVLRGRRLSGTGVQGSTLLLSIAPQPTKRVPDAHVDDLVVVDLRTLRAQDVLAEAQVPAEQVIADKAAAIVGGTVYWAVVPRGTQENSTTGTVLAYRLADGRTTVVGRAPNLLSGSDDPRGVNWSGGGVRASDVPAAVPPLREGGYDPVVSDGTNFAWLRRANPHVVGWTDRRGDARAWSVDTVGRPDIEADPMAVSGPYVFLEPQGYGNPHIYVLDTRSGAVVDSGVQSLGGVAAGGSRVVLAARTNTRGAIESVALDTAHLPELRCR